MPTNKSHRGPGFLFGVAIGAAVGTGALMMAGGKKTDKLKKKVKNTLDHTVDELKTKYPEQSAQVEDVLHKALSEAHKTSEEIKKSSSKAGKKAKAAKKTILASVQDNQKRSFTRKGKPLVSDS
ncbi:hypothetical protein ACFL2V_13695 [Pseudomonadota bacterium]